ncbi:S1 RNA-binding domain-containing protein [[Mycoplasma] collis]|uniref:S1 RNA-binding domain-containing protein n=1 Tax=[Mycoplasma] collis TaxID=2127 RepID=UPI00051BF94A|nr:S1 RNA-binding domain-containing protein [[Mycoplasma] collis]
METSKIVKGKIIEINKNYLRVILDNKAEGLVSIKEISDYFINDINNLFSINQTISLVVLDYNEKKKKFLLSFKRIRPEFLKVPFKNKMIETKEKFKNLIKFTQEEIDKWEKLN